MEEVKDKRAENMTDYPLGYILLLAFLAIMSGAEKWSEMEIFAETYKKKLNGIMPQYKKLDTPSHDTFRRVLGLIAPDDLHRATTAFLLEEFSRLKKVFGIEEKGMRQLCIDGKEQKGTGRKYGTDQKLQTCKRCIVTTLRTEYAYIARR